MDAIDTKNDMAWLWGGHDGGSKAKRGENNNARSKEEGLV
jgi:hypothetical protein